jgi:hypothetical protein
MTDYKIPDGHCPTCNKHINGATPVSEDKHPKPGDLNLCAGCGELLQFTEGLGLAVMPADIWDKMDAQTYKEVTHTQKLIRERRFGSGSPN